MVQKSWSLHLEDESSHVVSLEHDQFSGKREIYFDDQLMVEDRKLIDAGSSYSFQIGAHTCTVHFHPLKAQKNKYDCTIDNRSVETGLRTLPYLPLPVWAWFFMIACVVIPLATFGGGVSLLVGCAGAYGCARLAKDPSKDFMERFGFCVLYPFMCWIFARFASTFLGF